ncbi:hypothetical protein, partial [Halorubrum sp. SP9]|uniref:hypothetical protein n=1 Tax=Halorubrum sp. SP9 TaxID=1537267 RepID=UPI0018EE680E
MAAVVIGTSFNELLDTVPISLPLLPILEGIRFVGELPLFHQSGVTVYCPVENPRKLGFQFVRQLWVLFLAGDTLRKEHGEPPIPKPIVIN